MKTITLLYKLLFITALISFQGFSQNLLVNGGFESGGAGTGFQTNYTLPATAGTSAPREYNILADPFSMNTVNFAHCTDHSTGTGKMMVVDGSGSSGDKIWELLNGSSIGVVSGQTYTFSYWIRSISGTNTAANSANIVVNTNGTTTAPVRTSGSATAPIGSPSAWTQVTYTWTATTNNAQIWITDNQTSLAGNDFALDDFSLVPAVCLSPTITCGITTTSSITFNWVPVTGATGYTVSYQINGGSLNTLPTLPSLNLTVNSLNPGDQVTIFVMPVGTGCFTQGSQTCFAATTCPTPAVSVTQQPTCAVPTGTIVFTSPINTVLPTPSNLFISQVTDANSGSLSYIEIYNGTGSTVNLANYKIKIYNNGSGTVNGTCDFALSGNLLNNDVVVIAVGSATNLGGVVPDLTFAGCGGVNNNDNIRLATIGDVEFDLWGDTTGTAFTPAGAVGYSYVRNVVAPHPSMIWNPADWTATDWISASTEDYSNVGTYNYQTANYQYSVVSPTYQVSPTFTNLAPNVYNVSIRDLVSGCTSTPIPLTVNPITITPPPSVLPVTYCQNAAAVPLTATSAAGATLHWYTNPIPTTGETATTTAPTPVTTGAPGSVVHYYVSQTIAGCESTRADLPVYIGRAPIDTPFLFCDPPNNTYPPNPLGYTVAFDFNNVRWGTNPGEQQTSFTYVYTIDGGPPVTGTFFAPSHFNVPVTAPGASVTFTVTWNGICTPSLTNTCILPCTTNPAVPTLATTAPSCSANGFTTISNYNAAYAYTFTPAGPTVGAGGTITGMVLGTSYTVKAANGGCVSTASASFTNQAQLAIPVSPILSTTAPTCTANGSATISNYNAANTYAFTPTGPTIGAGGLVAGTIVGTPYTVTSSNGGCTSAASASFTTQAQLPTPAVPTINTISPTCSATGSTTITNYNAANAYTFIPAGPTVGAGGSIAGAIVGTSYTVKATNGGCTSAASLSFTNQPQLSTPVAPTLTTTAPTCSADGFTTITNYNAAYTYTFSPAGPTAGGGGAISGAVTGIAYTVKATSTGCISLASASFTNQPQLVSPVAPTLSTTAPTCSANGFTTITNYNAANTYTFTPTGPTVGAGGTISGATVGTTYTVKSTNAGGCTSTASLSFTNQIQLVTPVAPTLSTTAPTCTATGFTTITNYNAAYTYTFNPAGPTAGGGGTISGAVTGTAYTVKATSTGCISLASASFTNQPQLPSPPVPTLTTTAPTCTANGSTTISNYNAANTYIFTPIGPTVGAGGAISGAVTGVSYTVKSSSGGCLSASSLAFVNQTIITPAVPTLSTTAPTCTANGFTTITNFNPTYTYAFSPVGPNVTTGGIITATVMGTTYTVTATNNGCTSATSASFTNLATLAAVNFPTPSPLQSCDPNNDGFVTFDLTQVTNSITGGNPAYTVSFHETQVDADVAGTSIPTPGSYDNINPFLQTVYIRVSSNTSTCYQVIQLQLIIHPTPVATEPDDYELCDYTGAAGYEAFDLNTRIPEVLGSLDPTLNTVTFYTSLADAQAPSNAIAFPGSYVNATVNTQTIYIRVQTDATGCYDIVTLQLIVNPLPNATQPNYPQYSLCDTTGATGFEVFDLASQVTPILLGQSGMDVTFYPSLSDAQNDTNAITSLQYTNAIIYVQTLGIRITNHNTGCYAISTMDIRVEPLPVLIPPAQPYTLCDENQDGYTTFDLTTLLPGLLNGTTAYTVSFHETITDAEINGTTIPNPAAYDNILAFMQIIYVRAEDNLTHCVSITPIELNVNPSPISPVNLDPITVCDQDSNPQDAITAIDLTQRTADTLAQQTGAAANYSVTYYTSLLLAQGGASPIIPDTNYIAFNGETVWVRVEDNVTGCYNIGSFLLEINTPLLLTTPAPLSVCDADANPNDQLYVFDLTVKNNEINQGTGFMVTYYPSLADAQNNTNVIATPTAYLIQAPPVQTLGAIVTTGDGCQSITTLDIRVLSIPTPNTNPPPLAAKCDDNSPGDMLEYFDLTVNAAYIANNDPNVTLHYFATQGDAIANIHELIPANHALVGTNVWIRVENNRVDYQGNNCYVLVEQPLKVNPLPTIVQPLPPYRACDDNADGIAVFDLANPDLAPAILGTVTTGQQPADYTISYYLTQSDATAGTSALPSSYTNATPNAQDIYIRVVNKVTGCVNTGILPLAVEAYAQASGPQAFNECDNYTDPYDGVALVDLTGYAPAILNGQDPAVFLVSYYTTLADAVAGTGALSIAQATAYVTDADTDTIWVRVENSSNLITPYCYALTTIDITVERYPNPVITTANNVTTICVDFVTGEVVRPLTLDSGIASPSGYTFEWFQDGATTPIPGATGPAYTVDTASPGGVPRSYTVTVTSASPLACQTTSTDFQVVQSGQAVVPAGSEGYTVTGAFSGSQVITVDIEGYGAPDYQYSLDDGPRQVSNVFEGVSMGTHVIHVWDTKGDIAYSCEELVINEVMVIDYPHYFTPNGDGIHDTWNIVGLDGSAKILIFDRYGKLLKQISPTGPGWNGTYNGHLLPSDDYWFTVDFIEGATTRQFKAHFSMKR